MSSASPSPNGLAARKRREPLIDEFELAWNGGTPPRIEDFLPREPEEGREALFRALLDVEFRIRCRRREEPTAAEYAERFPQYTAAVADLFDQTSTHAPPEPESRSAGARFKAGDMIGGRYRIVARLGRGGMGEVYQAEDDGLQQTVALKFLPHGRTDEKTWVEQLKEEVKHARSISHKHVCQVHDYQEAEFEGKTLSFLVMAYASGGSLLGQANLRPFGRFAPEEVNAYAWQLCDALTAVHEAHLLHRDLKPGNVLLDGAPAVVKLADFGLAAMAEQLRPEDAGQGTWQYMAPEQLGGSVSTERSDLFALGLVLYELVTGRRPFVAKSRAELRERQRAPLLAPSALIKGLDPALDRVICRCLEHDPSKRPASAKEVKEALPPLSREYQDELTPPTIELRPKVALALLGAALAGLLLHALLADSTMAYRQLPPVNEPAMLRWRAAEIAESLRGKDRGKAEHSGFEWDLDLVKDASSNRPEAWHPAAESRSPLVYFWYRTGPEHHAPSNRFAPTDPPLVTSDMECVLLDLQGRLIEYHAVPDRWPKAPAALRDALREQCEAKLLPAAGLTRGEFRPSAPHYRPPVYADDLWGLEETAGTGKWVDVAVCGDRVVYFRVGEPFNPSKGRPNKGRLDRAQGENVEAQGQRRLAGGFVTIAIVLFAVLAAAPFAYLNWQWGRADLAGALRIVGLYAAGNTLTWLLITDHVPSLHVERVLLTNSLGMTAFWGAVLFVLYLAIEPHMRRRWPERLGSWNRVLSGKFRDPLVGRDVLVGLTAGVCVALPAKLAAPALGTYYLLAPVYDPLTPNVPSGLLFGLVSFALIRTAGAFVLLLLLGSFFRREWVAILFLVGAVTAGSVQALATFPDTSVFTWGVMLVVSGMIAFTIVRFGWIATFVALFVSSVLNIMPLTLAPEPWYATATLATAATLVALAVYGCAVSVGEQRFFAADA